MVVKRKRLVGINLMVRADQKEKIRALAARRKTTLVKLVDDLLTMANMPEAELKKRLRVSEDVQDAIIMDE